jgi:uncharacterized protein
MLVVDVNVLVNAHRPEAATHEACRAWVESARTGDEPMVIPSIVLAGFLRIVTHPRVFREPTPLDVALRFVERACSSPAYRDDGPGERHWHIFRDLCRRIGASGNLVPDAFLAAIAIELGAALVTADHGMRRFPGLRVLDPTGAVG